MSINLSSQNTTEIKSDIGQINLVEDFIYANCEACNFNPDSIGNVIISVTEAVNNAIVHGNKSDASKSINITVSKIENALNIEVEDQGDGFNFDNLPDPTAPENLEKEHGRGVFLMRSLSDNVDFENNGSKVVLTFYNG